MMSISCVIVPVLLQAASVRELFFVWSCIDADP